MVGNIGAQNKKRKKEYFDRIAHNRDWWKNRNRYYYDNLERLLSFLIPSEQSVLEIGCGTGDLLVSLAPSRGVGVDFSQNMIKEAQKKYPKEKYQTLEFLVDDAENLHIDEKFDYVVISDLLGELSDIWQAFRNLKDVVNPHSRLVITYFNALWEPILYLGEKLGLKMPQDYQNWVSLDDIENLLNLNGFEVIKKGYSLLFPKKVYMLSFFLNKILAKLPFFRNFCLVIYLVARPQPKSVSYDGEYSVSVVVPCRNERGNIQSIVDRLPLMGTHTEIIFVDGNSHDGTVEEIEKVIKDPGSEKDIKLIHQVPRNSKDGAHHGHMLKLGKGDAVRKGFTSSSDEILMILDADLSVPPEDLPKFYCALSEGKGEFINGTRLVYPMEKEAMRFLNKLGNKFFSLVFTWILDQRIKDTLCGTKVLFKKDYEKIADNRDYFGDFDPFGDFDLLFGAAKQNLKIVELPIRYHRRTYGEIKIQRFRHGLLLFKMSIIAMRKIKFR
ncbi:MAG: methyltransferase domain-containing protein [bacterium]